MLWGCDAGHCGGALVHSRQNSRHRAGPAGPEATLVPLGAGTVACTRTHPHFGRPHKQRWVRCTLPLRKTCPRRALAAQGQPGRTGKEGAINRGWPRRHQATRAVVHPMAGATCTL